MDRYSDRLQVYLLHLRSTLSDSSGGPGVSVLRRVEKTALVWMAGCVIIIFGSHCVFWRLWRRLFSGSREGPDILLLPFVCLKAVSPDFSPGCSEQLLSSSWLRLAIVTFLGSGQHFPFSLPSASVSPHLHVHTRRGSSDKSVSCSHVQRERHCSSLAAAAVPTARDATAVLMSPAAKPVVNFRPPPRSWMSGHILILVYTGYSMGSPQVNNLMQVFPEPAFYARVQGQHVPKRIWSPYSRVCVWPQMAKVGCKRLWGIIHGVSHSVVPDSLRPHGLQPTRLLCPWDFPRKDTGVGCHFLLQGIFPTQGSNPGHLHCRQILSRKISPICFRAWEPIPVFLPGESHGQRGLGSCSPWGRRVGHGCGGLAGRL